MADHVHVLVGLRATHTLADVVRELKKASSVWVHETIGVRSFAWQEGYSAFTVAPTSRAAVAHYVANQETHHTSRSFLDELRSLLKRAGVEYDPEHLG